MNKCKAKFRSKVLKYHDKWKQLLSLSYWKSKVIFYDHMVNDDGITPLAECASNWQYQEYDLSINEYELRKCKDEMIDKVILHELLHAVVAEMREDGIKHEERVVSQLQYSITNMLNKTK